MPKSTQTPNVHEDIENRFTYHSPKKGQPEQYTGIRESAKALAYELDYECPPSRELSLALTKLEEAVFWAKKAIARHGEAVPDGAEPKASDNYGPRVAIVCQARDREKYEAKHPSACVLVPGDATMGCRFAHIIIYGEASNAGSEWHETSLVTRAMKDCKWEYLAAGEPVRASSPGAIEDSPVYALKHALLHDRDYLLGWHANIACAVSDASQWSKPNSLWEHAQEAARRFIGLLFANDDQKPRPITDEEGRSGLKDDGITQPDEDPEETLEGAEILFGFLGWLTTRVEVSRFGASADAAGAPDLITQFCIANGISEDCRDDWSTRLTHPTEATSGSKPPQSSNRNFRDRPPPNTGIGWDELQRRVQERERRENEKAGVEVPQSPIDDSVLIELLGLMDITVTRADLSRWTVDQAKEAEEWADVMHRAARLEAGIPGAPALRARQPKPLFLPKSDTQLRLDAGDKEPDGT